MHLARIGLGSNLGDGPAHIAAAFEALGALGRVTARSSLYRTPPWGVADQADFTNAAGLLETAHGPRALLGLLQEIETRLGRTPTFRWGPRVIDLDILAFDDLRLDEPGLVIPHPRLRDRAFALVPLAEIEPAFTAALAALPAAARSAVQRIPVAPARKERAVNWDETLERVRSAAAFCADAGLARVRIDADDFSIEVRRALRVAADVPVPQPVDTASSSGAVAATNGAAVYDERPRSILKAEFVGIVRLSRPSVAVGAPLAVDRELAYVESLGIRNPIRSGGPGTVADIFVSDGQPVEYGQPLFAIEK